MTEIHILVADDHEIVRHGLHSLLESQAGWTVVAEAANGHEAVNKAQEWKPDVVILDIGMPELNGLEATRRIRQALPQTEVLILTVHASDQMLKAALVAGARGYLVKSDVGRDLIAAVERVARHKPFLSPQIIPPEAAVPSNGGSEGAMKRLTPREREIIQLLAEGHTNKEIATQLNISVKTAETHRTNVMRKIGIHSLSELVRYAIRNGIVEP